MPNSSDEYANLPDKLAGTHGHTVLWWSLLSQSPVCAPKADSLPVLCNDGGAYNLSTLGQDCIPALACYFKDQRKSPNLLKSYQGHSWRWDCVVPQVPEIRLSHLKAKEIAYVWLILKLKFYISQTLEPTLEGLTTPVTSHSIFNIVRVKMQLRKWCINTASKLTDITYLGPPKNWHTIN